MTADAATGPGRIAPGNVILLISLAIALGYYVMAWRAERAGRAPGAAALIAVLDQQGFGHPLPDDAQRITNRLGLSSNPLSQPLVNDLIVAQLRHERSLNAAFAKVSLIGALGWRYTPAVQNMLWSAAKRRAIPELIDGVDGLLRRSAIVSSAYQVTNAMIVEPAIRHELARRLLARPPWRLYYLQSASELTDRNQILSRADLLEELQRRGDRLVRNEIAPLLPTLSRIGRNDLGYALWRNHLGNLEQPLADPYFARAIVPGSPNDLPVIFEWQLGSGPGYYVDAQRDKRGPYLSLSWDGRTAPVLLSQQTTAPQRRLTIRIDVDGKGRIAAHTVGVRLICPQASQTFTPISVHGTSVEYGAAGPAPCVAPVIELYGVVRENHSPSNIVLRSITMRPAA